jgi:DNA-binding NarL/FixJ family response regulator
MKKTKAYIIDDHKIFRDGMKLLLEDMDNVELVGEASNGKVFIESLFLSKPDIAFIDISMPEMNGIETTKKALKIFPELKIIALTSFGEESYFYKMIDAGAHGFMLKTAERFEFEKAIQMVSKGENYFSHEILLNISKSKLNADLKKGQTIFNLLTNKEKEVFKLICKGLSNDDIAEELNISKRTIEGYRSKILNKTNCDNSVQLVLFAIKNDLLKTS